MIQEDHGYPGKLLVDAFPVQLQLVEDKSGSKRLLVRGEFARSGAATENKRVYSQPLWEREINRLDKSLKNRQLFGELDHPPDGRTQLNRVSHIVTSLGVGDDGVIIGEAEILPTDRGNNLKSLLNSGCRIGVSSRGYGSTKTDSKGNEVVQEDYKLVTFDFVADPADGTAYPEMVSEGKAKETKMSDGISSDEVDRRVEEARAAGQKALKEATDKARAELREEFSAELVNQLKEAKEKIREHVTAELLEDSDVAAAKTALDSIKSLMRPHILPEDVESVLHEKDEQLIKAQHQIAERDLQIKELEDEVSQLTAIAKEAGYKYYLESQISEDADSGIIRKLVGYVKNFSSAEELKANISSIR